MSGACSSSSSDSQQRRQRADALRTARKKSCGGGRRTWSVTERPAFRLCVSGKAIEKNLDSGSLYLIRTMCFETFLTTSCFVYSPPGTQPAAHVKPSPQSTPKRRMRSARPRGAGLSALMSFPGPPAGHEAGSPDRTAEGLVMTPDMVGGAARVRRETAQAV